MKTLLQRVIQDKETNLYPVWLMRQAGRYMPEYMAMKAKSNGFLDMAMTPWKAAEITMQPILEFDMDAAIIFSDILVINYALGQELDYNPRSLYARVYGNESKIEWFLRYGDDSMEGS